MAFLYPLFGALLGLWAIRDEGWGFLILLLPLGLFLLLSASKAKRRRLYLLGLALGLAFGGLSRFIPPLEGEFSGLALVIRRSDSYLLVLTWRGKAYISLESTYQVGDLLRVEGSFSSLSLNSYESRFDFQRYLEGLGVKSCLYAEKLSAELLFPLRLIERQEWALSALSPSGAEALKAIAFSRRGSDMALSGLAEELNLVYLLSASGFLYGGAIRLLSAPFRRISEKAFGIAELCLSLLFFPFSISKIGSYRVLANILLKRSKRFSSDFPSRLGASGLAILAFDPHFGYQSGFLLGYFLSFLFYFAFNVRGKRKRVFSRLFLILICLPASLSSSSGTLHLLSPLYAFLLSPLLSLIYLAGLFSFFFFPVPGLVNPLGEGLKGALTVFGSANPALPLPPLTPFSILLFYEMAFCLLFLIEFGERNRAMVIGISSVAIYLLSLLPVRGYLISSVSFINVGQGDSILIEHRGKAALVDTGGSLSFDMAKEVLIPYLRKWRVYSLDALIITHGDFDHSGAADSLLSSFEVKQVIDSPSSFPYELGSLRIDNLNDYGIEGENESSLVLSFSLCGTSFLLMGDATSEIERRIVFDNPGLTCDVLKVGHHGSDTSSCREFLLAVRPKLAIISVAASNSYGHPSPDVLRRLEAIGAKVRMTSEEGSIVISRFGVG